VIIGIVSPALHVRSGYGIQAAMLADRLRADGHQVVVFAISGTGGGVLNIAGVPHYPGGRLAYQADTLERHVAQTGAQVVLTLCDLAHQDAATIGRLRAGGVAVLHWVPADCEPLSMIDEAVLRFGGGQPVGMSAFGVRMLRGAGFTPLYVPHCVDTGLFAPLPEAARAMIRADQGISDKTFVVAWNGANSDILRKGGFEMWRAWAAFHAKHPDSVLWLHTDDLGERFDHAEEIRQLGLEDAIRPTDPHLVKTGQLDGAYMSAWYNAADVYLNTSWAEGFGVPLIESQACGLPVIGTDCSAVTELVQGGRGWLVPSELKYNPLHKRAWRAPWIKGIEQALTRAHNGWARGGSAWSQRRDRARKFASDYDPDYVYDVYWRPIVARLEGGEWRGGDAGADRRVGASAVAGKQGE
jgi:glycosyltransferase involved in cell wall biosynthesis